MEFIAKVFRLAISTADAGEPAAGVAAVGVALDYLLDNRPEEAILLLEAALILGQETIKVMKQHPIKDSLFQMSRTIDSRHSGRMASRNGPRPRI